MGLSIPQMALMSRLLDEALPLDTHDRLRWLEALAPQYESLAGALREALLPEGANGELDNVLQSGARLCLERIGSAPSPGDAVGPYRLIRLLGKGGMAEVWLAQRADGAFTREVALKLPMLSQLRSDLAGRFARERDILAALEHPNIARLYDAGVSANGLPYLAMEYISGESLTAWCDAHLLGIRERLELFLQVLDAVQYAHERHVIHRDIKPSNILVTHSGQVRLLDFGVAKLLARDPAQTNLTQRFGKALTPDYASPELVRGEQIGAPTDVYALGVVLYELLAGNNPYHLSAAGSITLLEEAIETAVVKRPSTQLAPEAGRNRGMTERKLKHRLKGDLDAIVLKALAKAPADRYGSAAAMGDDLRHTLRGQPVAARPDHLSYRYGKFMLRHRTIVATTTIAAVLVAAALGYTIIRTRGVQTPAVTNTAPTVRDTMATPPRDNSIAVLPFVDLSAKKDQEYFSDGLSEQLIDRLVHHSDLKVIARTSSFQFKGRNEDVRSIARQLGVSHVLEGSVLKEGAQLRVTAQLIRASDGVDVWSQTYDQKLVDIFKVQDEIGNKVASALHAALLNDQAVEVPEPDVEAYNLVLEGDYIKARSNLSDVEESVRLYRRALDINSNYALAWARLGSAYFNEEILEQVPSESQDRRVLDALERAIRLDPNLAWAYYTRAGFELEFRWNWAAAEADDEKVREVDPRFSLLPRALGDIALIFGESEKAIRLYQTDLERSPLDPNAIDALGNALCAANQLHECLQARLRLQQLHPDYGGVNNSVGTAYLLLGQYPEALKAMQRESGEDGRLAGLAMVYSALGRRADSDAALKLLIEKFASSDSYAIAKVQAYRGAIDAAFEWLDRGYQQHNSGMWAVKTDPLLRRLRGDPRFQALLSRMRLTTSPQAGGIPFKSRERQSLSVSF